MSEKKGIKPDNFNIEEKKRLRRIKLSFHSDCDEKAAQLSQKYPDSEGLIKELFNEVKSLVDVDSVDALPKDKVDAPEQIAQTLDALIFGNRIENTAGATLKRLADEFASKRVSDLRLARAEGFTSQRAIANRFNEVNVPTRFGGKWSQAQVKKLIDRLRELGLD